MGIRRAIMRVIDRDYADLVNVLDGRKPISSFYFNDLVFEKVRVPVIEGAYTYRGDEDDVLPEFYDEVWVYKNTPEGLEARETLMRAVSMPVNSPADDIEKHKALGRAFGYSDKDIAKFVKSYIKQENDIQRGKYRGILGSV